MKKEAFEAYIKAQYETIDSIRQAAWELHASVNQTYDKSRPYSYHLSMVADLAIKYGYEVVDDEKEIIPLVFGAYFHDSIEDARLTYNNVTAIANEYMSPSQAYIAAEIVYALTNEKGRTRAERANERYYEGIRTTPYAPFVRMCDRVANMTYSARKDNSANTHMNDVYRSEWNHFVDSIKCDSKDIRLSIPAALMALVE